ncbi:metallophosphoesterase [Paraherbaspirillum soli]|uniref:Metallophosphoesterase n=1 Tax=Paraherbaspirillum soli TaxID=631222 RepID=A0ABW0MB99_9BURK
MTNWRGKHNYLARRVGERALDRLLLGGWFAKWSYRFGLHGKLGVTHYAVELAPHKKLSTPLKIAFASDFHAGPTTHPQIFDDLFDEIDRQQADLLLLGGDFVSCQARYTEEFSARLSCLNPRFGKYAVLGNHDLWVSEVELSKALKEAGVEVLINQNCALPAPYDSVSICGLDDPWTGTPDPHQTFHNAGEVRILLMHAPDGLLLLDGHCFDFSLAGHTHGGQVALADGTPIVVPHGPLCRKYWFGRHAIENNGSLIVSRGIGCSTLPIRLNADPELVICTVS